MANAACNSLSGGFPWPPANAMAMSAFHSSDADIRWDDPSTLNTGPDFQIQDAVVQASVSIVVNGTPEATRKASGYFLVSSAPVPAGKFLGVDGIAITSVWGAPPGKDEFDGSSSNINTLSTRVSEAINSGSPSTWGCVTSSTDCGKILIEATEFGPTGNSIALYSNFSGITPSGDFLEGGSVAALLEVNGTVLTGIDGPRTAGGLNWNVNDPGPSLVDAINDPENGIGVVRASWNGTSVVLRSTRPGELGNKISVSSNSPALVVSSPTTQRGQGTPCPPGQNNSGWDIFGVNIYRSDTGERGPYFRVNRIPVQTNFYRDRTDVVEVVQEIIPWNGGWVFRGDAPDNQWAWRMQTRYKPLVKREGNAIPADSPYDVEVFIDGVRVPVALVFGPTGQVDLSFQEVWNTVTEQWESLAFPTEESLVTITYQYRRMNLLQNQLDTRFHVFYRLTTVARDPSGLSTSGLIETPLEYSPPISPMESEQLDYIWREGIRRNRWILEQGGERVKLFIRRTVGNPCPCQWDPRLFEFSKQPLNMCLQCYGTGFIGGYEGPYDIIIGPDESERRVSQSNTGRRLENTYEVWIGPTPVVTQRDFLVKQNGERFSLGPVRRTQIRGRTLQQAFQIGYLDSGDIRYRVPMGALERLPWPQTRYTNPEEAPCVGGPPYPVGSDYQATPMATDLAKIPDAREQRGRTPVWSNITYGGKGR